MDQSMIQDLAAILNIFIVCLMIGLVFGWFIADLRHIFKVKDEDDR